MGPIWKPISYKDSLIGHISKAYQQAFFANDSIEQCFISEDNEEELLDKYDVRVILSQEAKDKIRQNGKPLSLRKFLGKVWVLAISLGNFKIFGSQKIILNWLNWDLVTSWPDSQKRKISNLF